MLVHLKHRIQVCLNAGLVDLGVNGRARFSCCSIVGAHLTANIIISPLLMLRFPHSDFAITSRRKYLPTLYSTFTFTSTDIIYKPK